MVRRLVWILAALTSLAACAETVTVKMAEDEGWWGGANFFSREMPFSVRTSLKIDLRKDNYHNQGASLLLSNHGRVIRGNGQSTIAIRIDENHPVADWERVADIFERRGVRLSLAVVPIGEEKTDE